MGEHRLSHKRSMMSTEAWVRVEDVASHLGVASDLVYRCIEYKGLPAYRLGCLSKCKFADVEG